LPIDEKQLEEIERVTSTPCMREKGISPQELEEKARAIMTEYAHLSKTGGMLELGLRDIRELRERWFPQVRAENPHELMRAAEVRNIIDVAEIHIGRHFLHRLDYPTQDTTWHRQRVVVRREGDEMRVFKRRTVEQRPPTREEYEAVKEVKP